jgi:hypothetical protein
MLIEFEIEVQVVTLGHTLFLAGGLLSNTSLERAASAGEHNFTSL